MRTHADLQSVRRSDSGLSGRAVVQRVSTSAGGVRDTTQYEAWGSKRPDPMSDVGFGAEISLQFMPGKGAHNTADSSASKLTDNVPRQGVNTYGMRKRFSKNRPAKLWDMPSSAVARGEIGKSFETSAVVLEGDHAGTYLGSVGWGYKRPADAKKPVLEPTALTKLSDGNPTPEFVEAARLWNEQGQTDEGDALVPVPIPT